MLDINTNKGFMDWGGGKGDEMGGKERRGGSYGGVLVTRSHEMAWDDVCGLVGCFLVYRYGK
jgi:hypothetical protein